MVKARPIVMLRYRKMSKKSCMMTSDDNTVREENIAERSV